MIETKPVTADKTKLQAILAEKGLPLKVTARLNATEQKIHVVLCGAYDFTTNIVELEIPKNVLSQIGPEFRKIWAMRAKTSNTSKQQVQFALTPTAIKTTLKTALTKDKGIFSAKTDLVVLHESWAKYLKPKEHKPVAIDWTKAVKHAERKFETNKQNINDGKTFNAHKDNPWARKNLKNKNQ